MPANPDTLRKTRMTIVGFLLINLPLQPGGAEPVQSGGEVSGQTLHKPQEGSHPDRAGGREAVRVKRRRSAARNCHRRRPGPGVSSLGRGQLTDCILHSCSLSGSKLL